MKHENWQHEDVADSAVDGVLPLCKGHLGRPYEDAAENQAVEHHHERQTQDDPNRHEDDLPTPSQESVELQWDEDKLEGVDGQKQFQLEASLVLLLYRPNAEENADDTRHNQWDEHQDPEVLFIRQAIDDEKLKHQKNQMQRQRDEHRLELDVRVVLQTILRILEEYDASDETANNHKA